ncbi:3372_t:CDS:10, partial [Gigaspora margarita]
EELTEIIAQELHVDVAFPCFSVKEQYGSTACCVVHKHWLNNLRQSKIGEITKINKYVATRSSSNNISDQANDHQTSTTNVLVSIYLKRSLSDSKNSKPQLYARNPSDSSINYASYFNERADLPLKYFLKEQLEGKPILSLADIEEQYNNYVPIFSNNDFQNPENLSELEVELARQKAFVKKFIEILYPESAYFRIVSQPENDSDTLFVEAVSQPEWSSDMPITTSPNIIDVFAVLESERAYYFMAPYRGTTLEDLLKYSSGVLNSNVKKSFILYQLLRTVQSLHMKGVIHGGLKPSNILVDENLWVTLTGFECSIPTENIQDKNQYMSNDFALENIPKEVQDDSLTMKWVHGNISNFDYIMALNHLAGRRIGDPNFHPIFPWITDFTGASVSENWRDFTKTKFRLNKGKANIIQLLNSDEQLDFTYDGPVPHHITDILSDITYYVYLARKTPIPVLCQYVRTKYEPNEYPSSLQRLFEWTPDECIPEFYTDPNIFTSIHPDMPDLQLPTWASSAEEFIRIHSEALESEHVSKNLHIWIDLTFGCKLSGNVQIPVIYYMIGVDAVEAKNVALPLLDGQNSFMKHGITQLFSDPHPQKIVKSDSNKRPSVNINGNMTLLEKYESISSKKRIQFKPTDSNKQITEVVGDLLGSDKIIGKYQTVSSRLKSPRLAPTSKPLSLHEAVSYDEKDPKDPIARVEALSAYINSFPIHLPDDIDDEHFIENLNNFEQAHSFSAKYLPYKYIKNEYSQHFGDIQSNNTYYQKQGIIDEVVESSFAYGRAWDAYCLGEIIQNIYSAVKNDAGMSTLSAHQHQNDVYSNDFCKLPLSVQKVVSSLMSPNWKRRPSIDALLYSSAPAMGLYDEGLTLPLPESVPEIYEFLTDFHRVDWIGRLKLTEHWMERLCKLIDEAFLMILPSLVLLFTVDIIKIEALNIFSSLGQRLGQDDTKTYLLKPIISLFESSRPSIPKALFNPAIVAEFVYRFGITNFLQQLFPLYLEALTIEDNIAPYDFNDAKLYVVQKSNSLNGSIASPVSAPDDPSSLDHALPLVAQFANSALVDICTLIGPILASKHIMRQVYKLLLKESSTLPFLMQSILAIGNQFGETFTHLQFTQVISVIQQYSSFPMNKRNYSILCNHLILLEKLTTLVPTPKVLTEIESGFSDTLIKLLVQFNYDDSLNQNNKPAGKNSLKGTTIIILKNQLSISMKSAEFLLHVCNNVDKADWERNIAPILQKYFETFEKSLESLGMEEFEQERNKQIMYTYSQLCILFDQVSVREAIPASEAIELAMSGSSELSVLSFSAPVRSPVRSPPEHHFSSEGVSRKLYDINYQAASGVPIKNVASSVKSLPSTGSAKKILMYLYELALIIIEEMSNSLQFTFNDLKLRTFSGHSSAIRSFDVNEHTRLIASGSKDRTVKLWSLDFHNGIENSDNEPFSECLVTYNGHKKSIINDVHFINGQGGGWGLGDIIAINDGQIQLWDPETGKILHQFRNDRSPYLSIKPIFGSRSLVGGLKDTSIAFFDTMNYSLLHSWKSCPAFAAIGFISGVISLLESRTGTLIRSWKAGDTEIAHMKFYTNNYLVSCAPADHLICIWDTHTVSLINKIRVNSDIVSLNLYKDEVITVNSSNVITFTPLNDNPPKEEGASVASVSYLGAGCSSTSVVNGALR